MSPRESTRSRADSRQTRRSNDAALPPFPKQQMFVLALCRICEPIAFMSIFPYVYYMVKDFGMTEDNAKISLYAGMVTSAFTFAEFSTGMLWGRLSDKVGRKPILLMGLVGTALSVLVFGFAPSLPVALLARALGGLLNGNIGVLQTTVAELVTVKEHQPRAYTIMPLVWCLGSIIGPMIGGALARPCKSYPNIFSPGTIWDKFPYLLPNLFSACAVFCGVIIGILFLEETHAEKKRRHDPGLVLGRKIITYFDSWKSRPNMPNSDVKKQHLDFAILEEEPLLDSDDELPQYRSTETSPRLVAVPPTVSSDEIDSFDLCRPAVSDEEMGEYISPEKQDESSKVFTRAIILNILSYGILAFHTMTFDQLFPVFLSDDPNQNQSELRLPFKFDNGFSMDTKEIGVILSVQGGYSLLSNYIFFPFVVKRTGPRRLFMSIAMSYFLLYLVTPYLALLPERYRMIGIYTVVIWKCTFSTLAYPSNMILLTNSALSNKTLGTINGVAASTASLCRAFGPTISGALYTLGRNSGYSGLPWWSTAILAIFGAIVSTQIPEPKGRMDKPASESADTDNCETDPLLPRS